MDQTFSLYIHVPFCVCKCAYCDFFSVPKKPSAELEEKFVQAVLNECAWYKKHYHVAQWETVYIGGGTPSILCENSICTLLDGIKKQGVVPDAEITFEANPETVTAKKLNALSEAGVTRLSLGIQSMNDKALRDVGRHCTALENQKALDLVKKHWKGKLSLDCIAGLPSQTDEEFLNSLKKIISANADHISLYTLTLEEGTALYSSVEKNQIEWNEEDADRQWLLGRKALEKAGFFMYEVSNFCRPGFECVHNARYWAQKNYVGAGPASCGTVYSDSIRWTDTQDINAWLEFWLNKNDAEEIPAALRNTEVLDRETLSFEFLMLGLRTVAGVSENDYKALYGSVPPWNGNLALRLEHSGTWQSFVHDGKAQVSLLADLSRRFSLTPDGLVLLNRVLEEV